MIADWYYMDFKTKRIVPTRDSSSWFVPANIHIADVMRKKFPSGCTFREYKAYAEQVLLQGKYYHFDGRRSTTVLYEPLELDVREFEAVMSKNLKISVLLHRIAQLEEEIERKEKTNVRMVDIAIHQLENTIQILKKC